MRTAQTAHEALHILQSEEAIGFLLANVALQGEVSGIALGCIARELQPTLPIILMTGLTSAAPWLVWGWLRMSFKFIAQALSDGRNRWDKLRKQWPGPPVIHPVVD